MALLWRSHGILLRPYGVLVGDFLRSHDAFAATSQNKEEGKDQESIQSCTTPDQGHCRRK